VKQVRVLVAEDNEDHLFLTVRALREVDGVHLEIETVRDGEQALDFIHRRKQYAKKSLPHLVLLDIKMPKVDGLQVLRELKSTPELRAIPAVVLSSSERPEDIDETYRLGGNSYVTKPSNVTGLRDGLRRLGAYWAGMVSFPQVNGSAAPTP
jgi:CheY-like chemotaxis protein